MHPNDDCDWMADDFTVVYADPVKLALINAGDFRVRSHWVWRKRSKASQCSPGAAGSKNGAYETPDDPYPG
jgi:hypothetical protein